MDNYRRCFAVVVLSGMVNLSPAFAVNPPGQTLDISSNYPSPAAFYMNGTFTCNLKAALQPGCQALIGSPPLPGVEEKKLVVHGGIETGWVDFYSYESKPGDTAFAAPPVSPGKAPPAGRLFYNADADKFYYTPASAIAADPSTWYKSVSGFEDTPVLFGGAPSSYILKGSKSANKELDTWATAGPAGSSIGGTGVWIRSVVQIRSALYFVRAKWKYCVIHPSPSQASPTVKVFYRRFSTSKPSSSWIVLTAQDGAIPLLLVSGIRCGDSSAEAIFIGPANWSYDLQIRGVRDEDVAATYTPSPPQYVSDVEISLNRAISF